MREVDFWYDFVSPFSYIAFARLGELPPDVRVTLKPVLFAGLLGHWGNTGPAELAPKRKYMYRWCHWWAHSLGIPFRFPAQHPFNPLRHLRLAIACGNRHEAVARIFASVWTTGADAGDDAAFARLARDLGIEDVGARLGEASIKDALRVNTEAAIAAGVFGVPSYASGGEVFWGADALDFFKAWLAEPALLRDPEIARLDTLEVGARRSR
jgi:2-hydroxychromene-2-carboxylate isomerase